MVKGQTRLMQTQHVKRLRHQSLYGDHIEPHRALRVLKFPNKRWADVLLIPLVVSLLLHAGWPLISRLWAEWMDYLLVELIPSVEFRTYRVWFHNSSPLEAPLIASDIPTNAQWWIGNIFCAVCIVGQWLIPERWTPLRYIAGFLCLLQSTAQIYFYLFPGNFPYSASIHLASQIESTATLIGVMPWILGLVFNVFPFSTQQKVQLTSITVAYLIILTPLQYVLHSYVLFHGSMLWMPLLYFVGGMPLSIFVVICLYAWAMGWPVNETAEDSADL